MFREMRRIKQQLPKEECIAILSEAKSGVLALLGDDGYPYTVPLNYVYVDGRIIFHCGKEGHKIDAIKNCEKASFCVIAKDDIIKEKYTTAFKSVIAFGKLSFVENEEQKYNLIAALSQKYRPGHHDEMNKEIFSAMNHLTIIVMEIEHLSGKEGIELAKMRRN